MTEKKISLEYNSQRNHLVIAEYGRNIQKMIEYVTTIKDRDERNKQAKSIIGIMGQMNPHLRDITDFKHKLWDHLYMISDFMLDVDSPYPTPSPETVAMKPKKVNYPSQDIKYKHYGKTIELIIEKAVEYENGPAKDALTKTIANHLKKSYLTWNRDSVTDEKIFNDMEELSKGSLKPQPGMRLNQTSDILASNQKKRTIKPPSGFQPRRKGRRIP